MSVKVSEIVDLFSKHGKPLSKEAIANLKKHAGTDGLVDKNELKGFLITTATGAGAENQHQAAISKAHKKLRANKK